MHFPPIIIIIITITITIIMTWERRNMTIGNVLANYDDDVQPHLMTKISRDMTCLMESLVGLKMD